MGNICVIGPRGSGKTTCLHMRIGPIRQEQEVRSKNQYSSSEVETKELADKAENIILEGASLEPTTTEGGIDSLPYYSFKLEFVSILDFNT